MNTYKKWELTLFMGAFSSGALPVENGFGPPSLPQDTSFKFETERVERGARLKQQTFTPKLDSSPHER